MLDYLDKLINNFKQKTGDYPKLIKMNKETYDKLFAELDLLELDLSWKDKRDNYRGIFLKIENMDFGNEFLKLE